MDCKYQNIFFQLLNMGLYVSRQILMVWVERFKLPTSSAQTKRAIKLRHTQIKTRHLLNRAKPRQGASQRKTAVCVYMARAVRFELTNRLIQSQLPYRLATPQYFASIIAERPLLSLQTLNFNLKSKTITVVSHSTRLLIINEGFFIFHKTQHSALKVVIEACQICKGSQPLEELLGLEPRHRHHCRLLVVFKTTPFPIRVITPYKIIYGSGEIRTLATILHSTN